MGFLGLKGDAINHACVFLITMPTFLCYGYNQSVAGGLLTNPSFYTQFPEIDTQSTDLGDAEKSQNSTLQGTVIALYTAGGIFGALATCVWGDKLGRRNVIFIANILVMIGAILMASSFELAQMIVARVVLGLGTGAVSSTVPVWTSELAKIQNRGSHTSSVGFFLSIGIALGLWVDFGFSFITDISVGWRFPLAFQIVFCLCAIGFIYLLPESPRWLVMKGRDNEALHIMSVINECSEDDELIVNEVREIKHSLEAAGTWRDMLKMGETRVMHRAFLAFLAMFFSQVCAINALTFYANTIFARIGMDNVISQICSGSMEIVQIIGALAAVYTIDRFGRRALMLFSGVGMCICMALLAGCTSNEDNHQANDAAVFALFAINFIYSVGFAGCCFCYSAEISPLHVRSLVNGIAVSITWATNFLIAMVTPVAFDAIDWQYYIVWTAVNGFLITPIVYFFFPETKQRSCEQLDELFFQSQNIFDIVKIADKAPKNNQLNAITGVDEEAGLSTPVEEVNLPTDSEKK